MLSVPYCTGRNWQQKDWKYLRSIHDEMLSALCARIHREVAAILQSTAESEHAKYLRLYKHIRKSDDIIAACFNDWRRSTIARKAGSLYRHKVLTEAHMQHLAPETNDAIMFLASS